MIEEHYDARDVIAALDRVLRVARDPSALFADIGEFMVESTKRRFGTGTDPDGEAWADLSPVTIARKGNARPLIGESGRLGNEIFYRVQADGVSWGSALEYAAVQHYGAAKGQFGTDRHGRPLPWGDIPPRRILGVGEDDRDAILDIAAEHLEAAWLDLTPRG